MAHSMALLTQSNYYSPVLNGAIFDGPFKVYFSQAQESLGLNVYFQIQKKLGDLYALAKDLFKENSFNIYIMIYPTTETFNSIERDAELQPGFFEGRVQENFLIGINKEITPQQFDYLYTYLQEKVNDVCSRQTLKPLQTHIEPV